jgi:CheY-like chemotaxis protein
LLRALVADDSRVFRAWASELLRERGFDVVEAANGHEALDRARSGRPELLVLDALMPMLSGFDVLRSLREGVPDYHPKVMLVTAVYKSRRWESEARHQYRVDEYLEKPIEVATFVAAVGRHFPELTASVLPPSSS